VRQLAQSCCGGDIAINQIGVDGSPDANAEPYDVWRSIPGQQHDPAIVAGGRPTGVGRGRIVSGSDSRTGATRSRGSAAGASVVGQ